MTKAQILCSHLTRAVNLLSECRQSVRTGDESRAVRELESALRRLAAVKERLGDGQA